MTIYSFGYNSVNASANPSEGLDDDSVSSSQWRVISGSVGWAVAITATAITAITCACAVPLAILGVSVVATGVGYAVDKILCYRHICQTAGIIFNQHSVGRISNPEGRSDMIATEHGAETELWRERMIASAEHNIVISGNYCGGKAFDRMIVALERRLAERPHLKVVVIASPKFLEKKHYEKFSAMGENVALIASPDIWHISPSIKKSTNHTKVFVVDYGRYWIQGGSGIKDNFVEPGVDGLSRAQYRRQQDPDDPVVDGGLLGRMMPGAFRDQDFIGGGGVGRNTVGTQTYLQALLLANQMHERNQRLTGKKATPFSVDDIGILSGRASAARADDSLPRKMLREGLPPEGTLYSTISEFEIDPRKVADVSVRIFAQGPGHSKSPIGEQLIQKIEQAQSEILLNHMYIHPSQEIFDALVRAANRGVQITIITNGVHDKKITPQSHYFFAARNKYNYNALIKATKPELRRNVKVYEYKQRKKGNHKKVAIMDDYVIAGSSNLGLKSTKWSCDDELNFVARSQALADRVKEVCMKDIKEGPIKRSVEIKSFKQTLSLAIKAAQQRVLAIFID